MKKEGKKFSYMQAYSKERLKKVDPVWSDTKSIVVKAMVLTSDKLVIAGPPKWGERTSETLDELKEKRGWPAFFREFKDTDKALDSYQGKKGASLQVLNADDGKLFSQVKLDAPPVFDGMSVANGKVFVSLENGKLMCLE